MGNNVLQHIMLIKDINWRTQENILKLLNAMIKLYNQIVKINLHMPIKAIHRITQRIICKPLNAIIKLLKLIRNLKKHIIIKDTH